MAGKRVVCRGVAVMKPCEIMGNRLEEGAHVPPCPRRLMQVVTRLLNESREHWYSETLRKAVRQRVRQ